MAFSVYIAGVKMSDHSPNDPDGPQRTQLQEFEHIVCELAMHFRDARTDLERNRIVSKYQDALRKLINLGWKESLLVDCELPDRYMPTEYFELIDEMKRKWHASQQSAVRRNQRT